MRTHAIDLDRKIEVSEEQVLSYQENGYLQIHDVLNPEEVEQVRADLKDANDRRIAEAAKTPGGMARYRDIFHQSVNLWVDYPGLRRLTLSRRLGEIARRLTGVRRIRLWHDHSLIKMPRTDTPSPWHQDWVYWPMNQSGALSCWMALDDVDARNGCLSFIPESYRWGPFPAINLSNPQDILKMVGDEQRDRLRMVSMPMSAGSCTFHDGLCFHYAPGNTTDHPRRAMAIIYMPDGTTYRKKGHCVTDPMDLEDGVKLEGELFPIVAEGQAGRRSTFKDARPALAEAERLEKRRLVAAGV